MTTTASLIVTAEELPGLTCSGCEAPATHTLDLQQGTGTAVDSSTTFYLCQVHLVLALTDSGQAFPGQPWLGSVLSILNPNLWSA